MVWGKKGVHLAIGDDGRFSGDCYVELSASSDVKQALGKHKNNIGRRYIEGKLQERNSESMFGVWWLCGNVAILHC